MRCLINKENAAIIRVHIKALLYIQLSCFSVQYPDEAAWLNTLNVDDAEDRAKFLNKGLIKEWRNHLFYSCVHALDMLYNSGSIPKDIKELPY